MNVVEPHVMVHEQTDAFRAIMSDLPGETYLAPCPHAVSIAGRSLLSCPNRRAAL